MIYWIIISVVFGFCFGYFLGNWSAKDDKQNTKPEYKTTYSENLEHLQFNKTICREDYNLNSDMMTQYVIENIADQIKPLIKDKMVYRIDPLRDDFIYKFDLWVRR